MEKNQEVIGYARLTLLVLKRNPSLTYEEASELIGKAKTLNNGSLTGLRIDQILKLVKKVQKKEFEETKEIEQKKHKETKELDRTCTLCFIKL